MAARFKTRTQFLIALAGPVGAGKTYISKILSRKLNAVHINTDAVRVKLRSQKKSLSRAVTIANHLRKEAFSKGNSIISDFDAILPKRQRELKALAEKFGARYLLIKINTPQKLILERLRKKKYTSEDLFQNAREAVSIYFIRKRFHQKLKTRPNFVINNTKPLAPQIRKIVKKIKGL